MDVFLENSQRTTEQNFLMVHLTSCCQVAERYLGLPQQN